MTDTTGIPASYDTAPWLVMRGVRKRFGPTIALAGVDFEVRPGEVHALVGENGAGKSTLMKILSGAERPDAGAMELDGRAYRPRHPLAARREGVGMIYQELSLAPHLTVAENILLGMEPTRWGWVLRRPARQAAAEAVAAFEHPEIRPDALTRELSVGAQQLVEIGRALAAGRVGGGNRVLVFDEPTSSLNQRDAERLFEVIRRLRGQGQSIVYISHFLEEVFRIADRLTVLRDGRSVGTLRVADLTPPRVVEMMVGREVGDLYPRSPREPGEVVLELAGLAGRVKPTDASLSLRRGEVVGVAGLVGAGRTEMLRAVFGLDPVRSGSVRVGVHAGPVSPLRRWAQGVGYLSEDRKAEGLALSMSIADNMTLPRMGGAVWPRRQATAAWRWIDRLGIRCASAGQRAGDLSGGNQQKVAMARLLACDADVLLLDEPTRGIDVAAKAMLYRVIDELACGAAGPPRAVLMVSSYLPELLGVCDRIAVMHRGTLGPARPVGELDERRIMMEATGLEEVL